MFTRSSLILKSAGVCLLAVAVIAATTESRETESSNPSASALAEPSPTPFDHVTARNLALQPEALNLSRKLGKRYRRGGAVSALDGVVIIGGQNQTVRILRRQAADGEQIEIALNDGRMLNWRSTEGATASGARATGSDRLFIERLVFDSPDQFVLAQLRGASYFTVARNVRPVNAGDNYTGPLWNIVRVNDPDNDETRRPQSRWRLYYLNTSTGLVDRIESEVNSQRILAEVSGWSNANGERVPTEITWTRQGQTVMHFRLTNFSHSAQ